MTTEETAAWDAVEKALSPKQLKVINYFFGQYMRAAGAKGKRNDPVVVRRIIMQKLSITTYTEEETNGN